MNDIDMALKKYEPGEPKMKPDVLKQIKEIEKEHKRMVEEQMKSQQGQGQILLERPGEPPIALSTQDVVNIMKQQKSQIEQLMKRNEEMNQIIQKMQEKIMDLRNEIKTKDLKIETMTMEKIKSDMVKEDTVRVEIKEEDSDDEPDIIPEPENKPVLKSDPEVKIKIQKK